MVLPKYNLDDDLQHGTARYCGNHLELYNHNSTSTHTIQKDKLLDKEVWYLYAAACIYRVQ